MRHITEIVGSAIKPLIDYQTLVSPHVRDVPDGTVCAFSGISITRGIPTKYAIKKTFTDHSYLKGGGVWVSEPAYMCIASVFPSSRAGRFNALRNYHYLVKEMRNGEWQLEILNTTQILHYMEKPPQSAFALCFSFGGKKHTAYKCVINGRHNGIRDGFHITTDKCVAYVGRYDYSHYLPIIRKWYTTINPTSQTTFMNKSEISTGMVPYNKIKRYRSFTQGFEEENEILEKYRQGMDFKIFLKALNKTTC